MNLPANQIQEIKRIIRLTKQIQECENLTEFDTIKLPFELVQLAISLWNATFTSEVLQQVADADLDTLEAWAIALRKTLDAQLEVLNNWLPQMDNLSVPPKMRHNISDRVQSIQQIANEKSQVLKSAKSLFEREEELQEKSEELQKLKEKEKELQKIDAELKETDIDNLRKSIECKAAYLEPQKQQLASLQRQKEELDDQIAALENQQNALREEIEYWQSRQDRLETNTTETVRELITLTQQQRERLSEALSQELAALQEQRKQLAQQQESYAQARQQLQKASEDFQKYQTATEEIIAIVNTHYQSNNELRILLPIDRQKVDGIMRNIQNLLAEIDRELADARRKNEQAQAKSRITL
jgi:chromosome segregation ATPase